MGAPARPASATVAMLLADSRLPAGSHVSSNGLEAALRCGFDPRRTPDYMASRMRTVVLVEAGTAVVARATVAAAKTDEGGRDALARLRSVDEEWAARTPSHALRAIGVALGAGLARLACTVWPRDPMFGQLSSERFGRPVVLGAIAYSTGMEPADLARVVAYDDAQTVAAALLKLEPLDPGIPTRWVLDACAQFEEAVPVVAALTMPEAIPAAGSPQIEEWAEAHSLLPRRLFRA